MALELPLQLAVILAAVAAIYLAGPRLSAVAERVAQRLGVGQAVGGAVFLGLTTSLSGTVVSMTAAARGDASLALSNGLGGIAAQTAFLAVADFFHRDANLEHDSASVANLFQIGLLALLLSGVLVAFAGPHVAIIGVHPISVVLPIAWIAGSVMAQRTGESSPWTARGQRAEQQTPAGTGTAGDAEKRSTASLAIRFALLAAVVGLAGYALSALVPGLSDRIGLSRSAAGFLITATATSLPELVTTIAAVRRGALTFAVGNIVGGNAFDTLFCSLSDVAYRDGSIYHAAHGSSRLVAAIGLVMTSLLLLGLIGRERRGLARIGTESVLMLAVYVGGAVLVGMHSGSAAP